MNKKDAVKVIVKCAKTYHENLEKRSVMFLYWDSNNQSHYAEVLFKANNFLHFTGVIPAEGLSSKTFFQKALSNRLGENDFSFKTRQVTDLKLKILPAIMRIDQTARMIGDYNGSRVALYTDKIVGTTSTCLGLKIANNKRNYVPNSVLMDDIRTLVIHPANKILAVLKKLESEQLYMERTYIAPKYTMTDTNIPQELVGCISESLYDVLDFNDLSKPNRDTGNDYVL